MLLKNGIAVGYRSVACCHYRIIESNNCTFGTIEATDNSYSSLLTANDQYVGAFAVVIQYINGDPTRLYVCRYCAGDQKWTEQEVEL